ncbi:MAG: 4-(cytidine 5'-diphospho)-2-C-methyl-D-erythritol kinase [Candidatus Omnitrophica bacterium]|nr:4-(cytidine 5'-diphospho)-2-C-methyl-D-erythritol kinase [Candidatus Omnitrophota bacterium]
MNKSLPQVSCRLKKTILVKAYAKVNLFLAVLNKRKDNFHNLNTIFSRIDLADRITLKLIPDNEIKVICAHQSVPKDDSNLCFKAAKLLQQKCKCNCGVEIKIDKQIPVGAGLGGGSSDAAATLIGLNKLWKCNLSQKQLVNFAGKIGSDVAFFIYGLPFAQGLSRGEKVRKLPQLDKLRLCYILVVPKMHVSTPLIYRKFDEFLGLTKPGDNVKILNLALRKESNFDIKSFLFNSLEEVTTRIYPEVKLVKEKLADFGLKLILMSGSGPAVFGVVSSRKEAVALGKKLKKQKMPWQIFATRTI